MYMSKVILIFINIVGFLIFTIFNTNNIDIIHTAPKEIPVGEEIEVNLIINKDNFSGPGRLKLDLSQAKGILVKENMSDGSSFSFKENEVLFIWHELPKEKKIIISYTIIAQKKISGKKKISGEFSFINDNERKKLEVPELIFEVNPNLIVEEKFKKNKSSTISTRSIEKIENDYLITIRTTIDNQTGFARVKEELPTNFTAKAIETAGSVFKNIDGYVKFIWTSIPDSNNEIIVKYKISNNIGLDSNFSISGVFSSENLIMEGYNSGIEIPKTEYDPFKEKIAIIETDSVKINTKYQEKSKQDTSIELASTKLEENIITYKDTDEIINKTNAPKAIVEKAVENIITRRKVNNSIDYKVQILAGHRIISNKKVSNLYNYKGEYSLETHNGWIKYTVSSNSEYNKARDTRNELNNYNFPGPFVTAYNYGERISVQEALILTSQNWVP